MATIRSMSPCARDQTLKPGKCALMFIGRAERRDVKPECISPQIARQWARALASAGNRPALRLTSSRYWPITCLYVIAMLYQAYQLQSDILSPLRLLAQRTSAALWIGQTEGTMLRKLAAANEVFSRLRLTHSRPAYGIQTVMVAGHELAVTEEVALATPFGTLLHFRKDGSAGQPKVLLVAPLSGHFATLLRDTVRTLLVDH